MINEIYIKIKAKQKDVEENKELYFLSNKYFEKENEYSVKYIEHPYDYKELNKDNTKLYIDENQIEFKKYIIPDEDREYNIKLKIKSIIKDCSYMFAGCENITSIDFKKFNKKYNNNEKNV